MRISLIWTVSSVPDPISSVTTTSPYLNALGVSNPEELLAENPCSAALSSLAAMSTSLSVTFACVASDPTSPTAVLIIEPTFKSRTTTPITIRRTPPIIAVFYRTLAPKRVTPRFLGRGVISSYLLDNDFNASVVIAPNTIFRRCCRAFFTQIKDVHPLGIHATLDHRRFD